MEAKIQQVTIVVSDLAVAHDFYTRKVGFETKTDVRAPGGYRWVSVGPRGQELELALFQLGSAVNPEQQERAREWAPGKAPPIVLRVSDCTATYEELRARGVEFLQPPVDYPWGRSVTFADPDGNLFSLNQPPAPRSGS